jgi:hypothetical protein
MKSERQVKTPSLTLTQTLTETQTPIRTLTFIICIFHKGEENWKKFRTNCAGTKGSFSGDERYHGACFSGTLGVPKRHETVVRDSSLEKLAVERERADRQIEIKKVRLTFWARVLCGIWFGVLFIVEVELNVTYLPL